MVSFCVFSRHVCIFKNKLGPESYFVAVIVIFVFISHFTFLPEKQKKSRIYHHIEYTTCYSLFVTCMSGRHGSVTGNIHPSHRTASCMVLKASSRLLIPTRLLFHCCSSCLRAMSRDSISISACTQTQTQF